MTDTRMNSLHNLIEQFRGRKAESLNLDFSYHVVVSGTAPDSELEERVYS